MNTNVNSDKILLKKAINMGASSKTIILSQLKDRKTSQASLYLNHLDSTSFLSIPTGLRYCQSWHL